MKRLTILLLLLLLIVSCAKDDSKEAFETCEDRLNYFYSGKTLSAKFLNLSDSAGESRKNPLKVVYPIELDSTGTGIEWVSGYFFIEQLNIAVAKDVLNWDCSKMSDVLSVNGFRLTVVSDSLVSGYVVTWQGDTLGFVEWIHTTI